VIKHLAFAFLAEAAWAELKDPARVVRTKNIRDASARDALESRFNEAGRTFAGGGFVDRPVTLPDGLPLREALERVSGDPDVEFHFSSHGVWKTAAGYLRAPPFAFRRFRARLDPLACGFRTDFVRPLGDRAGSGPASKTTACGGSCRSPTFGS
jgi:hypothetical protein